MILGQLKQALAHPFWIFIFSMNWAKNDLIQYSIQNQIQNIHSKKDSLNRVYIFNGIIPSKIVTQMWHLVLRSIRNILYFQTKDPFRIPESKRKKFFCTFGVSISSTIALCWLASLKSNWTIWESWKESKSRMFRCLRQHSNPFPRHMMIYLLGITNLYELLQVLKSRLRFSSKYIHRMFDCLNSWFAWKILEINLLLWSYQMSNQKAWIHLCSCLSAWLSKEPQYLSHSHSIAVGPHPPKASILILTHLRLFQVLCLRILASCRPYRDELKQSPTVLLSEMTLVNSLFWFVTTNIFWLKHFMKLDPVPPYRQRIVGPGHISGRNIWRFPKVLLRASGAHLVFDTSSHSTFTVLRQTNRQDTFHPE